MLTNVKAEGIRYFEILCIVNKAESEGRAPAAGDQWGFEGGAPDAAAI